MARPGYITTQAYVGENDGLLDLLIGFVLLAAAVGMLMDFFILIAILPVLLLPVWQQAKNKLTAPRAAPPGPDEEARVARLRGLVVFGLVVLLVVGVAVFTLFASDAARALPGTAWAAFAVLVCGLLVLAPTVLTRSQRGYAYAALVVAAAALVAWTAVEVPVALAAVGTLVLLSGVDAVRRYVRTHPVRDG